MPGIPDHWQITSQAAAPTALVVTIPAAVGITRVITSIKASFMYYGGGGQANVTLNVNDGASNLLSWLFTVNSTVAGQPDVDTFDDSDLVLIGRQGQLMTVGFNTNVGASGFQQLVVKGYDQ